MLQNLTSTFFRQLAIRLKSENNLSDVTWAVCNSSSKFKSFFIGYFFPTLEIDCDIHLKREQSDETGRPDFGFKYKDKQYFIEFKKHDQNHHSNYADIHGVDYVALISIYSIPSNLYKYRLTRWKDFIDQLEVHLQKAEWENDERNLVFGYIEFVRQTCGLIKYKKMKLDNLQSLFQFNHIIKELVNSSFDNFKVVSSRSSSFFYNRSGYSFEFTKNDSKKWLTGWYGIYYVEEWVTICVGIWPNNELNENYLKLTKTQFESLAQNKTIIGDAYLDDDDNWLWAELNEVDNKKLISGEIEFAEQEKIITDFFRECIRRLGEFL